MNDIYKKYTIPEAYIHQNEVSGKVYPLFIHATASGGAADSPRAGFAGICRLWK